MRKLTRRHKLTYSLDQRCRPAANLLLASNRVFVASGNLNFKLKIFVIPTTVIALFTNVVLLQFVLLVVTDIRLTIVQLRVVLFHKFFQFLRWQKIANVMLTFRLFVQRFSLNSSIFFVNKFSSQPRHTLLPIGWSLPFHPFASYAPKCRRQRLHPNRIRT